MKKLLVWCLFFFCVIGCTGCLDFKSQENNLEKQETGDEQETGEKLETEEIMENEPEQGEIRESKETIGPLERIEKEDIIILTYGDAVMTGIARTICDSVGASHYRLRDKDSEDLKEALEEAECILLGTTKSIEELEFALRNQWKPEDLAGKKLALFLLNREEEPEEYEEKLLEWYPKLELLPTFTMETEENLLDELGRMNGWLTSVMTYGEIPE